ncbi:MAG: 30S ribosomal protein S12 methylthiotransferase RimO [Candidatus Delongbacteria bacterium]|jgi:ribosomal protein S12 methylthiotransferase|nr:30S ribosomal protein S12 methylthiotransferase RimO [Candidatus Delongbacteria bacterium]
MFSNIIKMRKANLITMGCSKNLVDSEKLAWQLKQQGWDVEHEAEKWSHDVVFINTCGFINDAKEESIEMILNVVEAKNSGQVGKIMVYGCLVERYREDLKNEIPEVDAWMGNYSTTHMMHLLAETFNTENKRINAGPGHYAYLKLAEGCSRKCAYCAIPLIKGKYVSRHPDAILAEAEHLASVGVKELLLIAQDLSYYGRDIEKPDYLPQLVEKLTKIKGIYWVRLHYLYPDDFPGEILTIMKNNPGVCNYLDIPLQHVNDAILKKMRRGTNKREIEAILQKARKSVPDIALRTSMMVGHPGETEDEFNELLEFIQTWQFDRLGVFTYSHEENTYGGKMYEDNIPEAIKQERAKQLMAVQENISFRKNQKWVGKTMNVLIERQEGDLLVGRSQYDSVEIDNEIYVESDHTLVTGSFCKVKILEASAYELKGKLINIL